MPFSIEQQREAHAEYKIYSRATIVKVRACAYAYTQKTYHNRHKRDNLISRGHLPLLCPDREVKVAKFQNVRTERNKRLFNMSESQNWGVWSNLFTDLVAFLAFREGTSPSL